MLILNTGDFNEKEMALEKHERITKVFEFGHLLMSKVKTDANWNDHQWHELGQM
jgi:hypothetical protein